jgi:hypothetical protein
VIALNSGHPSASSRARRIASSVALLLDRVADLHGVG